MSVSIHDRAEEVRLHGVW